MGSTPASSLLPVHHTFPLIDFYLTLSEFHYEMRGKWLRGIVRFDAEIPRTFFRAISVEIPISAVNFSRTLR